MPLVSIIIPTKNRRELLRQTLQSVVAQSHSDWEAMVIDDASDDGTDAAVRDMQSADARIKYIRKDEIPRGAPACRNLGISASQGEFLLFLDSDDLLARDCLENRLKALQEHPNWAFVATQAAVFRETPGDLDRRWNSFDGRDDLDRVLRADVPWQTAGPLWRRGTVARVGSWDEMAMSWQDWEFHARALMLDLQYGKLSLCDHFWREPRADSISSAWRDPIRLVNRIELIGRIKKQLRDNAKLTFKRRGILASLSFHMIAQAAYEGRPLIADRLADAAQIAGTISRPERIGLAILIRLIGNGRKWCARVATHLLWRWTILLDRHSMRSSTQGFATVG